VTHRLICSISTTGVVNFCRPVPVDAFRGLSVGEYRQLRGWLTPEDPGEPNSWEELTGLDPLCHGTKLQ
jgi:hypothetical protein